MEQKKNVITRLANFIVIRASFFLWLIWLGNWFLIFKRLGVGSYGICFHSCDVLGRTVNSIRLLKLSMAAVCIFHLVAGTGLMFSVTFQKMLVSNYGATLVWNDQ